MGALAPHAPALPTQQEACCHLEQLGRFLWAQALSASLYTHSPDPSTAPVSAAQKRPWVDGKCLLLCPRCAFELHWGQKGCGSPQGGLSLVRGQLES